MSKANPLFGRKTELIWDGKYDDTGQRVAPLRVALPFQTVETVNETAQERQKSLSLFESPGRSGWGEWRNRLIWGDKKYVLPSLLAEFAGKVNLIYIDPPFLTGADFSFTAMVPESSEVDEDESLTFTKQPSIIEQRAYRDTWGRGLDSYLQWFYEAVVLLHELLHETGSIYVHLDWHVAHYAKAVLDEVFGDDRFVNEIVWKRQSAKHGAFGGLGQYGRIHESILFYTKSDNYTWNQLYTQHDEDYVKAFYKFVEKGTGRRYRLSDLTAAGGRRGQSGAPIVIEGEKIRPAPGRHWAVGLKSDETVQQAVNRLLQEGRILYERGKMPSYKRYLDEMPGVVLQDIWADIKPVPPQSDERQNYATQKPEALLDRIIGLFERT
jgi:adenine-specific DNA-methyltransferase